MQRQARGRVTAGSQQATDDLWAMLAEVNKKLIAITKEIRELSDYVYEDFKSADEERPG